MPWRYETDCQVMQMKVHERLRNSSSVIRVNQSLATPQRFLCHHLTRGLQHNHHSQAIARQWVANRTVRHERQGSKLHFPNWRSWQGDGASMAPVWCLIRKCGWLWKENVKKCFCLKTMVVCVFVCVSLCHSSIVTSSLCLNPFFFFLLSLSFDMMCVCVWC